MKRLAALALFCGLLTLGHAGAQEEKPAPKTQRSVYVVKNTDAITLAEVVARHYKGEADVIAAPLSGNAVLVSGPAGTVPEVVKLLEQLDRQPRTIEVEVTLTEVPAADWKDGEATPEDLAKAGSVQRIKLTATEGQPVTSTTGGNKPMVSGEALVGPKGPVQRSINYVPVGTTVKLTARVGSHDAVAVDLDLKDSRVKPAPAGAAVSAPTMETATLTTKLSVSKGRPVVAQAVRTDAKDASTVAVVIVTARVVDSGTPPAKNR